MAPRRYVVSADVGVIKWMRELCKYNMQSYTNKSTREPDVVYLLSCELGITYLFEAQY